ncbi:response regulator transcription factor [Maritimibacter sp. DP1N21-5]|uniref:response regulator transcription factor n=1 Tax=Maritimibacter sp. DP1N21-5 TaxID=2836867 RepID=UPI001C47FE13|nr:response regulator transcription factor [Maritimibacter sp. DP1N21-5]MBV7410839.1 response regulator transcription factor [Maritimibacter sp. DP1N21-5]
MAKDGAAVDTILIDGDLPSAAGADTLAGLVEKLSRVPVAVLVSPDIGRGFARKLALAGAAGIFPSDMTAHALGYSLLAITPSKTIWIAELAPLPQSERKDRLSEREFQVLVGICEGLQNKEIAHGFEIQEVTVKMHVRSIIRKLGARNRTHAAMIAIDRGLIG